MQRYQGTAELDVVRSIPAGFSRVPYQLGGFHEFREALLATVSASGAFSTWKPEAGDPGLMLLEGWAYIADIVSFYEEYIVNESLLSCAIEDESVRSLITLLGHVPRPAIAHRARLVVDADRPLTLERGFEVKSEAVEGGPQTFEVDATTRIGRNQTPSTIRGGRRRAGESHETRSLYAIERGFRLSRGERIVVDVDGTHFLRRISAIFSYRDERGRRLRRILLGTSITYEDIDEVDILVPTRTASMFERGLASGEFDLDRRYPDIREGDLVFAGGSLRTVESVTSASRELQTASERDADDNLREFFASIPVTSIELSGGSFRGSIRYAFESAARLVEPVMSTVDPDDVLDGARPPITTEPFSAVLADSRENAYFGIFEERDDDVVALDAMPTLFSPVSMYPAFVDATQGSSHSETLASSDGEVAQSYTLSKKPLTYLPDRSRDTAHGFASTLEVWVDGIRWKEVPSFFGEGAEARVFVVRQDGDDSTVYFGDGVRGAVPPLSAEIVARYRFGAGGPTLASGQLSKPSEKPRGLRALFNVEKPWGGAEAEGARETREAAPRGTLTLGRIVSLEDLEAHAMLMPGVDGASSRWVWDSESQVPVAHVWYLGSEDMAAEVREHLRTASDPKLALRVSAAQPRTLRLDIEIAPEADFDLDRVVDDLAEVLAGEDGVLLPESMGIGAPLIQSELFETIHEVEGVDHVVSIRVFGYPWSSAGVRVWPGQYIDLFETGRLRINAREVERG